MSRLVDLNERVRCSFLDDPDVKNQLVWEYNITETVFLDEGKATN